jgi:hypothetical protein
MCATNSHYCVLLRASLANNKGFSILGFAQNRKTFPFLASEASNEENLRYTPQVFFLI